MKSLFGTLLTAALLLSATSPANHVCAEKALYVCSPVSKIDKDSINTVPGKVYFDFHPELTEDSFSRANKKWLGKPDMEYFTAYFFNTTDTLFQAERQDGSLMMIQEALLEDGRWLPIEYWVHSGCGNSYFNPLKLEPNTYVVVPIRKYSGDYKTKVRLKMKQNGQQLFVSKSFEASIDKGLFNKRTGTVNGILFHGSPQYFDK